ncbi:MAG TPA: DUF5666 domain-containing protein [Burkholderiales bacterium]|nr:DUF5666 domain-containing protein [Burkholderiales bacterium]
MACGRRISIALLLFAGAALAQAPERVRGVISSFDGKVLTVGDKRIAVTDKTEIVFNQPIRLADLKPGDFLGVTSTKRADGSLSAYEVRRFPKPVNPGHRPFDGRDDQTMTNATVSASVESLNGRELTMTYAGGSAKIVVPESASVSMLVPGTRDQLVLGAPVNLTHDASGMALRIQVGPKR